MNTMRFEYSSGRGSCSLAHSLTTGKAEHPGACDDDGPPPLPCCERSRWGQHQTACPQRAIPHLFVISIEPDDVDPGKVDVRAFAYYLAHQGAEGTLQAMLLPRGAIPCLGWYQLLGGEMRPQDERRTAEALAAAAQRASIAPQGSVAGAAALEATGLCGVGAGEAVAAPRSTALYARRTNESADPGPEAQRRTLAAFAAGARAGGRVLVRLETRAREYVVSALLPAFLTPPAVVDWGDRTFLLAERPGVGDYDATYRECFAVKLTAAGRRAARKQAKAVAALFGLAPSRRTP